MSDEKWVIDGAEVTDEEKTFAYVAWGHSDTAWAIRLHRTLAGLRADVDRLNVVAGDVRELDEAVNVLVEAQDEQGQRIAALKKRMDILGRSNDAIIADNIAEHHRLEELESKSHSHKPKPEVTLMPAVEHGMHPDDAEIAGLQRGIDLATVVPRAEWYEQMVAEHGKPPVNLCWDKVADSLWTLSIPEPFRAEASISFTESGWYGGPGYLWCAGWDGGSARGGAGSLNLAMSMAKSALLNARAELLAQVRSDQPEPAVQVPTREQMGHMAHACWGAAGSCVVPEMCNALSTGGDWLWNGCPRPDLEQALAQLDAQYNELHVMYTDKHLETVALERTIANQQRTIDIAAWLDQKSDEWMESHSRWKRHIHYEMREVVKALAHYGEGTITVPCASGSFDEASHIEELAGPPGPLDFMFAEAEREGWLLCLLPSDDGERWVSRVRNLPEDERKWEFGATPQAAARAAIDSAHAAREASDRG